MQWLGGVGIAFVILAAAYLAMDTFVPASALKAILAAGMMITGVWLAVRLLRRAARIAVWRLRNRLLVTYLFISVVPILLVVVLAVTGAEFLARQLAVYLVTSRNSNGASTGCNRRRKSVIRAPPSDGPAGSDPRHGRFVLRAAISGHQQVGCCRENSRTAYSAIQISIRRRHRPPDGWGRTQGTLVRDGQALSVVAYTND